MMARVSDETAVQAPSDVWTRVKKEVPALTVLLLLLFGMGGGAAWIISDIKTELVRMEDRLVERFDQRFDDMEKRIDSMDKRIDGLSADVTGVIKHLARIEERLARIEGWIAGRFNRPLEAMPGDGEE